MRNSVSINLNPCPNHAVNRSYFMYTGLTESKTASCGTSETAYLVLTFIRTGFFSPYFILTFVITKLLKPTPLLDLFDYFLLTFAALYPIVNSVSYPGSLQVVSRRLKLFFLQR